MLSDADPEAVRLDDLDSNASLDEDAVPMRKVTANNKVCTLSTHVVPSDAFVSLQTDVCCARRTLLRV